MLSERAASGSFPRVTSRRRRTPQGARRLQRESSVIATTMEAELPVIWLVMDNMAFGTITGLEAIHRLEFRMSVRAPRQTLLCGLCSGGAIVWRPRSHD